MNERMVVHGILSMHDMILCRCGDVNACNSNKKMGGFIFSMIDFS